MVEFFLLCEFYLKKKIAHAQKSDPLIPYLNWPNCAILLTF